MRPEYAKPGRVGSRLTPHFVRKMVAVSGELLGENSGIFGGSKLTPLLGAKKTPHLYRFFEEKEWDQARGGFFKILSRPENEKKKHGGEEIRPARLGREPL